MKRLVRDTVYCQVEECTDSSCPDTHVAGVSIWSLTCGPQQVDYGMLPTLLSGARLGTRMELPAWPPSTEVVVTTTAVTLN